MKKKQKIKAKLLELGDSKRCCILFAHRDTFKDHDGCLKEYAHNDAHIFRKANGELIEWEYDDNCGCGCLDNIEYSSSEQCILFNNVTADYKK